MSTAVLRKEGKHHRHHDLEFWAEDGLILIEDHRDGSFSVITCRELDSRVCAMMGEHARCKYASDTNDMRLWLEKLDEVWKDAKAQGDPSDPAILKKQIRERRRISIVTGSKW